MSECPKFGEQMNCPKEEPVECDLFIFCEFITWEREKNQSSNQKAVQNANGSETQ